MDRPGYPTCPVRSALKITIESTFATDAFTDQGHVTKGPGSRAAGIAMAYKLIDAAQTRWAPSTHPTSAPSSVPARCSKRASYWNVPSTSHPKHQTSNLQTLDRRTPQNAHPQVLTISRWRLHRRNADEWVG